MISLSYIFPGLGSSPRALWSWSLHCESYSFGGVRYVCCKLHNTRFKPNAEHIKIHPLRPTCQPPRWCPWRMEQEILPRMSQELYECTECTLQRTNISDRKQKVKFNSLSNLGRGYVGFQEGAWLIVHDMFYLFIPNRAGTLLPQSHSDEVWKLLPPKFQIQVCPKKGIFSWNPILGIRLRPSILL